MKETRDFDLTNSEVREVADGFNFRGYAAVFDSLSHDLGGFKEIVRPGAFTRSLKENPDVRMLFNHDPSKILARTPRTLKVQEDSRGLAVEAQLPNTSYGRDLAESLGRGDISQMSFRFRVKQDEWENRDGTQVRSLKDVDLVEVSAVTFPAYDAAEGTVEQRMIESAVRAMDEVRAGRQLSSANRETLRAIMKQLEAMLLENDARSLEMNPKMLKLALRDRELLF